MTTPAEQDLPQTAWANRRASAAEAFERIMVPAMFRPWAIDLIKLAGLKPGGRVLDVACGTGIVTRLAAEAVGATGTVVGVDISTEMLKRAQSFVPSGGAPITWRLGNAAALPLVDASCDAVFCQHGLQFFADRVAALREMRRVLTPDGWVAVAVWRSLEENPGQLALNHALARWTESPASNISRAAMSLGDTAELQKLFTAAGFHDVVIQPARKSNRFRSVDEFITFRLASMDLDDAARAEVSHEVGEALKAYTDANGIAIPSAANLVSART